MKVDRRGRRAWIKVQLTDKADAHEASEMVRTWKGQRQAAHHLLRAVQLYAALCRGDASVLEAYFPGLAPRSSSAPVRPRPSGTLATVSYAPRSETEELDEALSGIGLDGLDF